MRMISRIKYKWPSRALSFFLLLARWHFFFSCQLMHFQYLILFTLGDKIRYTKSCFMVIKNDATVVHALVTSRLDNGNAILYRITECQLNKLQLAQNSAA